MWWFCNTVLSRCCRYFAYVWDSNSIWLHHIVILRGIDLVVIKAKIYNKLKAKIYNKRLKVIMKAADKVPTKNVTVQYYKSYLLLKQQMLWNLPATARWITFDAVQASSIAVIPQSKTPWNTRICTHDKARIIPPPRRLYANSWKDDQQTNNARNEGMRVQQRRVT